MRSRASVVSAVATLTVSSLFGAHLHAANKTFDGGAGTVAGNINDTLPTQQTINSYLWDVSTTANWSGDDFDINDAAIFNQASGNFAIRVASNTLNPLSMTFTGGGNYDFLRGSTSVPMSLNGSSGNYEAWQSVTATGVQLPAPYNIAGADTFSSVAITNTDLASLFPTTSGSITLGTSEGVGFTGTVILRNRPGAAAGWTGAHIIHSGTLEVRDAGALPGVTQNSTNLTLNGGTFAVNITQGSYTFRTNNIAPSSTQLGGTLNVTADSVLANTATDIYGRAREQSTIWNGVISVPAGETLTINTGGGTTIGQLGAPTGAGTIRIGAAAANNGGSNRLRLTNTGAAGSQTNTFDLGSGGGILQNAVAINGTTHLGGVVSVSGTTLTGTTTTTSATASASNLAIGAANGNSTIAGTIVNGVASSVGGGTLPAPIPPAGARLVANTNLVKNGSGGLALNNRNYYGGSTTVNAGQLTAGNAGALGSGPGAVTVAANATVDLNGFTQTAGKAFSLAGGSLVNNGAGAVTIHNGASANFTGNATNGSGNWFGAGNTPTVAITGDGSGATAQVIMQLGWLRHGATDGGVVGSGYATEPKISFSAPDLPASLGGRPIKAVAVITNNGSTVGQVTAINIIDPGFGYTSVPTISIDNTGTGGSGFMPVVGMTAGAVHVTNGGTGYTTAPTVTFGGPGYMAGSAIGLGGFGSVALTATSNIGGSGNIAVDAVVSGGATFGLNKIGGGTVLLNNVNTYTGLTDVQAGTLGGTGSIAGNLEVDGGAFLAPGASIESFGVTGDADLNGTLLVEYDGTGSGSIDVLNVTGVLDVAGSTVSFSQLGAPADDGAYVFATYGTLNGTFGTIGVPAGYTIDYAYNGNSIALVPEPATLGLAALAGVGLLARRRRRVA